MHEEFNQEGGNLGRWLKRNKPIRPDASARLSELKQRIPPGAEPFWILRTGTVLSHSDLIP